MGLLSAAPDVRFRAGNYITDQTHLWLVLETFGTGSAWRVRVEDARSLEQRVLARSNVSGCSLVRESAVDWSDLKEPDESAA